MKRDPIYIFFSVFVAMYSLGAQAETNDILTKDGQRICITTEIDGAVSVDWCDPSTKAITRNIDRITSDEARLIEAHFDFSKESPAVNAALKFLSVGWKAFGVATFGTTYLTAVFLLSNPAGVVVLSVAMMIGAGVSAYCAKTEGWDPAVDQNEELKKIFEGLQYKDLFSVNRDSAEVETVVLGITSDLRKIAYSSRP